MAIGEKEARPLPAKRWQFSLRELMLWMLVLSIYFGAAAMFGRSAGTFGALIFGLYLPWYIHHRICAVYVVEFYAVLVILGLLAAALCPPSLAPGRTPAKSMMCRNNLKQIELALQHYHDVHGSFPPAYVADSAGRAAHSWRVLILPFMEQKQLYARYRFDEPWDGPNNRLLADDIGYLFQCPSDERRQPGETNYVVVVGRGTVFPDDKCTSLTQITDGTPNTLLVVEVHNSGIHWMEPRDLHMTQMATTVNPKAGQGLSSMHPRGAQAVFVDGHAAIIPSEMPPDQLRALLTINGGETILDY